MTALDHYISHGIGEGLSVTAVSESERGTVID